MKSALIAFLTMVFLTSTGFSTQADKADKIAKISAVEYEIQGKQLIVKIKANQNLEPKNPIFEITPNNEHIFFVDIPNTYFIVDGKPHYHANLDPPSPISKIRISQYKRSPAISRTVFFLREPSLPTIKAEDNTLIFEISATADKELPTLPTMEKTKPNEPSEKSGDEAKSVAPIKEEKDERVRITQIKGFYESEFTKLFIYSQAQLKLKQANLKPRSVLRLEFTNDTIISPDEIILPPRGLIKQVVADGSALMIYLDEDANYEIINSDRQLLISFKNPVLYHFVSLNIYDEELGKVILMLFRQSGANILIDKGVEIGEKITTQLEKVPLKYALNQILESHGYGYKQAGGGIIRVLPLDKLLLESDTAPKEEPIETKIFSVKHGDPIAISTIIQQMTTNRGKVVAESQTKAIVVKDTPSSLENIEKMILQLDRKPEAEEDQKKAAQVAQVEQSQSNHRPEDSVRTEKRLVKISYADPDRVRALLAPLLSEHGRIYIIQPSLGPEAMAKGVDPSKLLAQATSPEKGSSASGGAETRKRGGHIIIEDVPESLPGLEEAVKELDKPTPQIDIQVYIVSGSVNSQNQMGLDWSTKIKSGSLQGTASSSVTSDLAAAINGGTLQLGTIPAKDFSTLLKALSTKADVQILSNPRITVLENQKAHFISGRSVPYTKITIPQQAGGLASTSTEFLETGMVLDVTPRVLSEEMVSLEVTAEVSEVEGRDPAGPIIAKSKADTELFIKDGNTAVIGGFSRDEQIKSKSQIPILGDIPILGKIFGSSKREKRRNEVTIFITPHIVSNQQK